MIKLENCTIFKKDKIYVNHLRAYARRKDPYKLPALLIGCSEVRRFEFQKERCPGRTALAAAGAVVFGGLFCRRRALLNRQGESG